MWKDYSFTKQLTRLYFCDVTIVPTHDEMTSHAAGWPTSLSRVKVSLNGWRRILRSRYAAWLLSSAIELTLMADQ